MSYSEIQIQFAHPGEACIVIKAMLDAYRGALDIIRADNLPAEMRDHVIARLEVLDLALQQSRFDLVAEERGAGAAPLRWRS